MGILMRIFIWNNLKVMKSPLRGFVVRGSSRLRWCAALRGFVVCGSWRLILPLKPVLKAWTLWLLVDHYLHREGIVIGHVLVVGETSDLGLRS